MEVRRWLDRAGFLGTVGSVLVSGAVQGLVVLSVRVELAFVALVVVLLQAVLSSLTFAAFVAISGGLFGLKLLRDRRSVDPAVDGGRVVAIVPVHQDAGALDRSVTSLLSSTYRHLAVRIVCEPGDEASHRHATRLAEHDRVEVQVNTRRPGTKAGAVNTAVDATGSEYVAVFDADERVDPAFVGHAVSLLDEHDIVQGRTVPEPTGAIEGLAYYESVLLSYAARRLLYLLSSFRVASSRAIVMRRDVFERVGGYDPQMLTEDFDFAYRCYSARVDVRETVAYPSRIEAAHSLTDWWGQRKRWMTGYVQVLHRLVAEIDPRDHRRVLNPLICASTVVGSALMLSLLSKFMVLFIVGAEAWFLPPVAAVFAVTLGVHLYDTRTADVESPFLLWLLTPVLFPLYGAATIKAVFEYLLSWEGDWYAVEKN